MIWIQSVSVNVAALGGSLGATHHGGQHALHHGADNVENITKQPDNNKLN